MSAKKKIIVLTSRDNFVWTSMQEIIPMIEHAWSALCIKNNYEYILIDVDQTSPAQYLQNLISSDLIVITCFNTKIARFVKILRGKLKIDTQIFFYLHGLATIALWPLQRFEILSLLTSNDLFIGTCEGDIRSLNLSLSNARSAKVPFTISNLTLHSTIAHKIRPFVYIGRISPQKNLDQLILAYAELSDSQKNIHPLFLYGTEDHLGYPNLGIKENNYLDKLKELVKKLNLETFVIFKGFVDRLKIQEELGDNYVFVSPSTHSDENFGMAAFRALLTGVPCILTNWGGHSEFPVYFPEQIYFLTPTLTKTGSVISAKELKSAFLNYKSGGTHNYPSYFTTNNILKILEEEMQSEVKESMAVKPTLLAENVFKQQEEFEKNNEIERCFHSFEDPAFISFFQAYSGQ